MRKYLTFIFFILLFIIFIINNRSKNAYGITFQCPPFSTEIELIENEKSCLSVRADTCGDIVEITSHCREHFYYYNEDGILNTQEEIINVDDYTNNQRRYLVIEKDTGVRQTGRWYAPHPRLNYDILACYEGASQIINGVDFCNKDSFSKLQNGTILKNWEIKLKGKDTGTEVKILGKTSYMKRKHINEYVNSNILTIIFSVTAFIFLILGILLIILKYLAKKNISLILIILIFLSGFFFYFLYLLTRFIV